MCQIKIDYFCTLVSRRSTFLVKKMSLFSVILRPIQRHGSQKSDLTVNYGIL